MISLAEGYRGAVISMLLRMMAADGHQDRKEFLYILKVAGEMGMTQEDIAVLTPESLELKEKMPENEKDRMTILYFLILMMEMDGIVNPEEEILIREFGYHLGFRIELVADLIRVIKTYSPVGAPTEEVLNTIRPYLN
ncbi:MAG: TerB family tellurite resistance protein [Bacteroidota bacterium]|nr:TerB family tellurite resistance protein [Bacteroidota bacterium]